MASYKCRITFGGVNQTAFADWKENSPIDVESAVKQDAKDHYDRRPDDLQRDMNISVDCELADKNRNPNEEFDEEVRPGIWVQR